MFKQLKTRPMTWGRYHVHAAKIMPKQIDTESLEYMDSKHDIAEQTAYKTLEKDLDIKNSTCIKIAYQRALVTVPVAVKPYSVAGPTNTLCCSDPVITNVRWKGSKEQVCYFTITQEICVEIPVHFGAEAHVGLPGVDCLGTSLEDCEDCMESDD
jgi:hypothetical protein